MLDLDKLEALADAATPGPWEACMSTASSIEAGPFIHSCVCHAEPHEQAWKDAAFIAEARTAVPKLIALVHQLTLERKIEEATRKEFINKIAKYNCGSHFPWKYLASQYEAGWKYERSQFAEAMT